MSSNRSKTRPTHTNTAQTETSLKSFDERLAGVKFVGKDSVVRQLTIGEQVWLRREPNNPHDPNAVIAERLGGSQIGYVRRALAASLALHLDQTVRPIEATITELRLFNDDPEPEYRIGIRFSVPSDWLKVQEVKIEYHYDESGASPYILLNCSPEQLGEVRNALKARGIKHTFGLCFRPSDNGRDYDWYLRTDVSSQVIAEFFKTHFNLPPETDSVEEVWKIAEEVDQQRQQQQQEKERLVRENETLRTLQRERPTEVVAPDGLADLFDEFISENLTPSQSLHIINRLFPTRIEVLDSAFKSAKASESFRHNKKLFSLLWELATGYWYALAKGRGDVIARLGFGEHYAAQESENVQKNQRLRKRRTFIYAGDPVQMMKHLKIGVKSGVAECIRVHFEWDASRRIIVIGHCGQHLDLK